MGESVKKEIKDRNKSIRERIKQLEIKDKELQGSAQALLQRGQQLQQEIATINTERLKLQGGIEELKKQVA